MTHPRLRVYGGASGVIAGRLRVVDRRFQNDAGWFPFRCVSELAAMGYILSGRRDQVLHRLDAYVRAQRTVVRVFGMLGDPSWVNLGLAFTIRTPGYYDARAWLSAECATRGLYIHWSLFCDAQIVMPDPREREACADEFADYCRATPNAFPGLSNEPYKNGWPSAVDPALLALAERFAARVGHRDFTVGDPPDGDNVDASEETVAQLVTLSQYSNAVVLHPDRAYGADERFRRWLDHLEGITDVIHELRSGVAFVNEEPIGAGLVDDPGRRDSDPDALAAGPLISAICGLGGYCYHWRDTELTVEQLPGFYGAAADIVAAIPCSPDWRYENDGWSGAPTDGISWVGKTGKMRSLVRGSEAWTIAYGEADWHSVRWREGWTPTLRYSGPRIRVWCSTKD